MASPGQDAKDQRPRCRYVIELEDVGGEGLAPVEHRLRGLLKVALRRLGLRCREIRQATDPQPDGEWVRSARIAPEAGVTRASSYTRAGGKSVPLTVTSRTEMRRAAAALVLTCFAGVCGSRGINHRANLGARKSAETLQQYRQRSSAPKQHSLPTRRQKSLQSSFGSHPRLASNLHLAEIRVNDDLHELFPEAVPMAAMDDRHGEGAQPLHRSRVCDAV